jgi:uncharacterized cupredoxin-like copper-binding protein
MGGSFDCGVAEAFTWANWCAKEDPMRLATRRMAIGVAALSLVAVGCAGGGGGEPVNVVLGEFVVEPEPTSASAGEVTFTADNQGGETHELVVVQAASADELPVDEDGAFDEESFGEDNVLGEVEDVESGTQQELTLDMESGTYVLLCNVTEEEDGEIESHFSEGMHTTFNVE